MRDGLRTRGAVLLLALALPLALVAVSARAVVPGQVDFQGLLLDSAGDPTNGAVTLVFTLYDAPAGGSALWTETHAGVQVVDGVYGVTLGSQVPITPALLATGDVHLEIEVDGETLSPRRALLAVPYAVRADSADNALQVDGVSGVFVSEIVQHFAFDGGDPPNDDPSEGVVDTDLDGLANFIDPDNDDDGLSDGVELAQGSDINLVTPVITQVTPPAFEVGIEVLTVDGTGFLAGLTVLFDGAPSAVSNLTPTSFDVTVTGTSIGDKLLEVMLTNGESTGAMVAVEDTRRVFVTQFASTGNLGGIAGADALCDARAAELGIVGATFFAWLADSTTDPATRFEKDAGPYRRLSGVEIAADWADLTDGTLSASISTDPLFFFSNVETDGTVLLPGGHCQNWTSGGAGDTAFVGLTNSQTSTWTLAASHACNTLAWLVCFEQE